MQGGGRGRAAALVLVLALVPLAGCGGGSSAATGRAVTPAPAADAVGAAATTTPAAELRAGLTWQLVERVHLLALARQAVVRAHGVLTAPDVRAVEDLLEASADDLVRTTGTTSLRGPLAAEAEAVLADRPVGALHEELVARLARADSAVAAHDLVRALDQATAGLDGPDPAPDDTAAGTAAGLVADAVARQRGLGPADTPAAVLRADLTRLLVSRTYLVGTPADDAVLAGLTSALAERLVGDPAQRGPVRAALRAGHTALYAEATARAQGDRSMTPRASAAVLAADRDLARRLSAAVPALPVDVVARALDPERGPLLAAAGARAAGDLDAGALSADTASRAVVLAAALAAGVADQGGLR